MHTSMDFSTNYSIVDIEGITLQKTHGIRCINFVDYGVNRPRELNDDPSLEVTFYHNEINGFGQKYKIIFFYT